MLPSSGYKTKIGVAECFDCCCGKRCGFQILEQSLKTTRFIEVWCEIWPMNNDQGKERRESPGKGLDVLYRLNLIL